MDGKLTPDEGDWHESLFQHLLDQREPSDPIKCAEIRRHAT